MLGLNLLLLLFLLITITIVVDCSIKKNVYDRMPVLYQFNDYDRCLSDNDNNHPTVYCLVKSLIKPDTDSELWHIIENYTKEEKIHFQHDELLRGLCLKTCWELLESQENDTRELLYQEKFNPNRSITLTAELFPNTLKYRKLYDKIMNECINLNLRSEYNLTAYSEVEYCVSNEVRPFSFHFVDKLLIVLGLCLFVMLSLSTVYDMKLSRDYRRPNHYATTLPDKKTAIMCTFSIPRNWSCLAGEERTPLAKDLRFVHCLRFLLISWVVCLHCVSTHFVVPIESPQVAEENVLNAFLVGIDIIRFFFVLSSMLITILDIDEREKNDVALNVKYFWKGIIDRYMRFMPVYASILLVRAAPMFLHLGGHPIFDKFARLEGSNCRKNWWSNFLFINNIAHLDDACIPESWYLATDLQLFIFARLVRMIIWKNPKLTKVILAGGIALSYLCVGWVHYHNELEGALVSPINTERVGKNLQRSDKYIESYTHPHLHFGDALIGIVGGIAFHHLRRKNINLKDYKSFKILWYLSVPVFCCIIEYSKIFFRNDFEKPALWIAVSAAFVRHLWAWLFCWYFLGLAFEINSTVNKFHNHPIFRVLGKLSFCVYLLHFVCIALALLQSKVPLQTDLLSLLRIYAMVWALAFLIGFFVCLLVELPFAGLYKEVFKTRVTSAPLTVTQQPKSSS